MLIDEIRQHSIKISDAVLQNRKHLHANPELSFHEYETSAFIKARLDEMGISWKAMAGTGVVALIKGEQPSGRVIALRADMDALPITEANDVQYKSKNKGVMHACGHDVHTASLLGTADILQSIRHQFGGTVKLIFQPAEEKLPGGASLMIKEGVLKDPVPEVLIGQHVSPSLESGKIGIHKGKFMASMDEILVTVQGKGGHAAQPHQNIDPIMIAAQILVSLQQVVSRMANPTIPTVLSFGKLTANGAINVIPDEVHLEGTFRTLDEGWRIEAHAHMKKIAKSIAEGMGGSCDFNINKGYPFLINEEKLTEQILTFAGEYLGKENIQEVDVWMAAEDFAYYSQSKDSCFYLIGIGNKEKGIVSSLHTPTFDIDENALITSIGLMAYITVKQLGN
ncbi:MAG TPA: M20 family metallopeptidase [Chitinophagaceae bacterium]|nr:M20 family metallopeptidase [Chitinophagaceae bacterium]